MSSLKRYILTGTPGAGKTSLIRALEMQQYAVIEEAATDLITYHQASGCLQPWQSPAFIDQIVKLQRQRQFQADNVTLKVQFYDRSPLCTYALALYLNFKPSKVLMEEIERIQQNHIYEKQVFFIENLGFIIPTEARKISFEEALRFEHLHAQAYAKWGYQCVKVGPGSLKKRLQVILQTPGLASF